MYFGITAPHAGRLSPVHMLRKGAKGFRSGEDGQEISLRSVVVVVHVRVKADTKWWKN